MKFTGKTLCLCFMLLCIQLKAHEPSISERKKIRYLQKIERKNQRFVKNQEQKTVKILETLSAKEKALYNKMDSISIDSSVIKNGFSKIEESFTKSIDDPESILGKSSQLESFQKTISISTDNLTGDIKNYLSRLALPQYYFAIILLRFHTKIGVTIHLVFK